MARLWRRNGLNGALIGGLLALIVTAMVPFGSAGFDRWLTDLQRSQYRLMWRIGLTLPGTPDLAALDQRLTAFGAAQGAPVLIRVFKRESELELWLGKGGRFERFATYPVCRWSGWLGPKQVRGDRQVPEGFYSVTAAQLNPNSRWHRSFNIGYPNRLDRQFGRTGDFIMVHGGCSSVGCLAVTDQVIDELWRMVTAALTSGQKRFQVQIYPFRMTDANLALYADSRWARSWRDLKQGYDLFETSQLPPVATICGRRYAFAPSKPGALGDTELKRGCPSSVAELP